jgi:hypothetical protein
MLENAFDIHVHCTPDVVERAEDLVALADAAQQAGMAGIVLKDHTTSTVGRVYALNRLRPEGPRFYSALALNLPVGGVNPLAVISALRAGASIIYMPTYCGKFHIETLGYGTAPAGMPLPEEGRFHGYTILTEEGALTRETLEILDMIADHDAVLATGHLSPMESLPLLEEARRRGVRRMIVTHASEKVPGMRVEDQNRAIALGASIEHCFLPCSQAAGNMPVSVIAEQIRGTGIERVILSSDFGQIPNGPIVPAYQTHLELLRREGFTDEEMHRMIVDNPRELLKGK